MKLRLPRIQLEAGDRWMDSQEIAVLFGVDQETVNRWRRRKVLRGYKPARKFFYKKSDVNRLLSEKGLPELP